MKIELEQVKQQLMVSEKKFSPLQNILLIPGKYSLQDHFLNIFILFKE